MISSVILQTYKLRRNILRRFVKSDPSPSSKSNSKPMPCPISNPKSHAPVNQIPTRCKVKRYYIFICHCIPIILIPSQETKKLQKLLPPFPSSSENHLHSPPVSSYPHHTPPHPDSSLHTHPDPHPTPLLQ